MSRNPFLVLIVGASLFASSAPVARSPATVASADGDSLPAPSAIPLAAEHHYRLSGAARPFLLFWIGRDNVGGGRMTWRRATDGTLSVELLSGSDPERAPFGTNRWAYIREVVRGDEAELLAVKSETEEDSIEEAKESVDDEEADRLLLFIRDRITAKEARSWHAVRDIGREVSFRDVDFVLERMSSIEGWKERRLAERPPETRPGFLVALTDLMQASVEAWRAEEEDADEPSAVMYIHRARLYELRQAKVKLRRDVKLGNTRYPRALEGEFKIQRVGTDLASGLTVIYGMDGPLAAVPLQIQYRPRWWLKTALTLDDSVDFSSKATSAGER